MQNNCVNLDFAMFNAASTSQTGGTGGMVGTGGMITGTGVITGTGTSSGMGEPVLRYYNKSNLC